jgi:hypothetical protein
MGEHGERRDVEVDLQPRFVGGRGGEGAVIAEAGVVDEQIGHEAVLIEKSHQRGSSGIAAEISGEAGHASFLTGEACFDLFEHITTPGHENEFGGVRGELTCKLRSEAGGGTGDEGAAVFERETVGHEACCIIVLW